MRDVYKLEVAQKLKKKKDAIDEEQIDEAIKKEAARIEEQNYEQAKAARKKLEISAARQKQTTDLLRRHGEKVAKSKRAALNIHENVGEAESLAEEIERESHFFNFSVPFWRRIKKWWTKDSREEREVQHIREENDEMTEDEVEDDDEVDKIIEKKVEEDEYIPGERKTNRELQKILKTAKKINKEAELQTSLTKKQAVDLREIAKINEYSKKKVDKTDAELRKGL